MQCVVKERRDGVREEGGAEAGGGQQWQLIVISQCIEAASSST